MHKDRHQKNLHLQAARYPSAASGKPGTGILPKKNLQKREKYAKPLQWIDRQKTGC